MAEHTARSDAHSDGHDPAHDSGDRPPAETGLRVLIVADPGLPSRRVDRVHRRFERLVRERYGSDASVATSTEVLRVSDRGYITQRSVDAVLRDDNDADVTLFLTEIPRHSGTTPLVAEVMADRSVAIVSCPTLGAWATKRRIVTTFLSCLERIVPDHAVGNPTPAKLAWSHWSDPGDDGHQTLHTRRFFGAPRLVLGMTLGNDPWRTAPKLTGALAAASATAAFGVFYSSIWQMASYLSTQRMVWIALVAISAMVMWLITTQRLWDTPRNERLATVVAYYNLSTVLTLFLGVVTLYLLLVAGTTATSLVVIDPEFMAAKLDREAQFSNYLDLGWLSAAMGIVAGGLGAGFDADANVKQLTHGQRLRQRVYTEPKQTSDNDRVGEGSGARDRAADGSDARDRAGDGSGEPDA